MGFFQALMSFKALFSASRDPLCVMMHSTQTMSWRHLRSISVLYYSFVILQMADPDAEALNGSLKVERAVLPPSRRVAAIRVGAIVKAISTCWRTFARRSLVMNVLPVPPGACRKKIPPLRSRIEV